ncbi:MAG: DedA family protein [Myxococcales bacterium]|nr:DedA family protein [Myxococcales bacterium]
MLDSIAHWMQNFIADVGYPGLFLLIVLESTMVPVPSLLVMPFAGYMASQGKFSLPAILAVNSAAAMTGSLISYWIGAAGGKPLLLKWGKYVFVRPADIEKTEQFFARHGAWTVLIARFLPVVRHLISIPAGIARMRLSLFMFQTFLGSTLWGGGLMVLGYQIGANWGVGGQEGQAGRPGDRGPGRADPRRRRGPVLAQAPGGGPAGPRRDPDGDGRGRWRSCPLGSAAYRW